MPSAADVETPVAIVGGGPIGLMTAILLAGFGIRSTVIERKSSTAWHPKARGVNLRTIEIFRQCGLEQALFAAAPDPGSVRRFARGATLTGPLDFSPFAIGDVDPTPLSPTRGAVCSQDVLESILLRHALRLPAVELLFDAEVFHVASGEDRARLSVRERIAGTTRLIDAAYVVAADGARSPVRHQLGIAMPDPIDLTENVNVLFEAPLADHIDPLGCTFINIDNPLTGGVGVVAGIPTGRNPNEWTYNFQYFPENGQKLEDFDAPRCTEIIRAVTGIADLPVRVVNVSEWTARAAVAEQMRKGRVLLAGDSAHLLPPAGGLGMNTGMLDALALAWRLAAVTQGWGGTELLDDYNVERLSAARFVVDAATDNLRRMAADPGNLQSLWGGPQYGLILGVRHVSDGIIPEATGNPPAQPVFPYRDYVPVAAPGARAPHVWLDHANSWSTLDLMGWKMVLIAGGDGPAWRGAAAEAARLGSPISVLIADEDVTPPLARARLRALYGIGDGGAVLVRPDGVVAWRTGAPRCATTALIDVLARILRAPPRPLRAARAAGAASLARAERAGL